jgi:multidrug efflux pump subunit AcrA (membrane-fusion protein)
MRRIVLVAAVALGVGVVGLLGWRLVDGGEASGAGRDLIITAPVERRTLSDTVVVRGVLARSEVRTVYAAVDGRVSGVPVDDGATVDAGDAILSVEGRASIAVPGSLPFFRPLDVGSEGPDVRQLEEILAAGGYGPGPVDGRYTEQTRSALAAWQTERGYPGQAPVIEETLTVSLTPGTGYTVGPRGSTAVTIGPGPVGPFGLRQRPSGVAAQTPALPIARLITGAFTGLEGQSYDLTAILDIAQPTDITIPLTTSGTATAGVDYLAPGAVVVPAGATSVTFTVEVLADGLEEPEETIGLALATGAGYSVGFPSSTTITIPATSGDVVLTLRADNSVVNEGTQAAFTVSASEAPEVDVEVALDYRGTATPGADYNRPTTVTLTSGRTEVRVQLPISQDGLVEPDETIEVVLLARSDYLVGQPDRVTMTIRSSDVPELTLTGGGPVGEGATRTLTLRADAAPVRDTTVGLNVGGTATASTDYVALPATVLLAAGRTTVAVDVQTLADDIVERPETVVVSLAPPAAGAYRLGPSSSQTVTIEEGDATLPALTIRADAQITTEGRPATFTVESDRRLDEELEVWLDLRGTATRGVDVDPPPGRVVIPAGQRSVQVSVNVRQDDLVEADETVELVLQGRAAYRVGAPYAATTVIQDDDVPELSITGGGSVAQGGVAGVTITADQAPVKDTSVTYQVVGTARPGVDFAPLTGTALLRAGVRSVTVPVRTIDESVTFRPTDMIAGDWPARVGRVLVEEGQLVGPGQPLFTITETRFTITLRANATDRSELAVGQEVDVRIDAGGQRTRGVITALDEIAKVDPVTGAEQYEGTVEITDELAAVDGASARLEVVLAERLDAIVVPIAAVSQDGAGGEEVRIIDLASGEFRRVRVETGLQEGSYIEILAGLTGDEIVVVEIEDR